MGKTKTKQIMKRALSLFLTLVMLASMGLEVFAESVVYATDDQGNSYTSISNAWNAAKQGRIIKLKRDWRINSRLVLNKGESATIDMNGLRIDRQLTNDDYESDGEVIYLDEGASLVLRSTVTTTTHDFTGWENGSRKALKITNGGLVTGGWSSNGAGGVHMKENSTLVLDNVAIAGNRAEITWAQDGYGGGVMMDGDNCTLTMKNGAQIAYNEAQDEGGGVYSNGSSSAISLSEGSSINHNRARDGGGGIYFCYSEFVLESKDATGSISDNKVTDGHGGAIFTEQCAISTNVGVIYGITMKNNSASERGGAIYLNQESITVSGCTIEDNSANEGGGIYVNNDDNTLSGCTIQNNIASSEGGGVFVSALNDIGLSGTLTIKNNNRKDGAKDDLFLNDTPSANAYITGVPTVKSEIGIRTADTERKFNGEREFYNVQAFFSDFNGYHIEFDGVKSILRAVKGDAETVSFTEVDPEPNIISSYNNYPLIHGYFQYGSIGDLEADLTSDFYYSDGYFMNGSDFDGGDPNNYNSHLATMSMTMAMASFGSDLGDDGELNHQEEYELDYTYKSANIEKLLTDIGIVPDDIFISDTYSVKPGVDTIGVAIGHKHIYQKSESDDESAIYTLIPIVIRSGSYESEWASNVTLGSSGEAKGFASAANQVFTKVREYIDAYNLTGDVEEGRVKFWIMGYSRGGATSNLTAKRLIESYCYDYYGEEATGNQVYAYCFEAPQGGRNSEMKLSAEKYYCIHNCINKVDAVPEVAPDEMGFIRYGVDHYVPGDAEAAETPNENNYVWSFVTDQEWANSYKTWYDNESWAVGSANYKEQRAKMLEQLNSIDPINITFFDNFEIAEMDIIPPSIDPLSYDGTPITQEQFIHVLIRAIQAWGLYNSNEGDFRDSYNSSFRNGDGCLYPSLESALQVLVPIVFAKSSEELEGIMSSLMSGKDALIGGLYGKARGLNYWIFVIGDWTSRSQSSRNGYLNQLWNTLICTQNPLTGKSVADYLTSAEYKSLMAVWDMLLDVALRLVEVDYDSDVNKWNESKTPTGQQKTTPVTEGYTGNQLAYGSHSLVVLGTLAYNTTVIAQGHYPEINFAWLRSYDSFYDTSKSKSNPITIDMDSFDAPTVTIKNKDGLVSIESDIEGAAVFYRISNTNGVYYGEWMPFNQPFTPTGENIYVQATAIYCGKTSEIETQLIDRTEFVYYTVTVDGTEVGSYVAGAKVTVDGTDKDRIFDEWTVESGNAILENTDHAVTSFIMPDENVVLTTSYSFTRSKDVKLTVDKPVADEELPTTGTFTWTVDGKEKTRENVPVYWVVEVDGNTQTASGKAKYGTAYTVAALIKQDLDDELAFAFDLDEDDAEVKYEGVDISTAYDAYVDDAGSLRIYGNPVKTEDPAWDIYLVLPTILSVSIGLPEAELIEKLPDKVSVIMENGLTTLSVDKSKADTSAVIEDGKVAKEDNVTIPIPYTNEVALVMITIAEEQVDEPIIEVESGEQTLESSTVQNRRNLRLLTALYDITPLTTDANGDIKTFRNKTELKVTLNGGEDETIKYTIRKESDNADDEPEVYTYTEPFTLTGAEGEKTTYVLTTWAEKGADRSSDVTCTYILDNPYTVTINGTDTGLLGIQNKDFTDFPKTYYYYNGDKVTIAAPAEADELFEEWESVPDGVIGDVDDVALTVESMSENIELTAIYNPVINKIEMTIDTPCAGIELPKKISSALVTVTDTYEMADYFLDILWTPTDTVASANTVYTAKMMLNPQRFTDEAKENDVPEEKAEKLKYYLSEKLVLEVNDNSTDLNATVSKQNDAIYVTFSETGSVSEEKLVAIEPFTPVAVTYEQAENKEWNLPENATLRLSDGSLITAPVDWTMPEFSSKTLSYTVTGTVSIPNTVRNPEHISNTVTILVLVVAEGQVLKPYASVPSGTYDEIQYVRLYCITEGAEIYYTLDGSTPTEKSTHYAENTSIKISGVTKLNAIAIKDGVKSEIASYSYMVHGIEPSPEPTPTPTPVPTVPDILTTKKNKDTAKSDTTSVVDEIEDTLTDTEGYAVCNKSSECPLAAYSDLDVGAWYHDGVHYCLENGIMNGYSSDTFGPNDSITRAQAVTILWRIAGSSESTNESTFSDVAQDTYYATAVAWATENGIVLGYEDGTFHPNAKVTREQLAAILYRYAAFCGIDTTVYDTEMLESFGDAQSISSWALDAMQWVCENGIINGTESGLIPQGTATRAQSAAIFQRFSVLEK